MQQAGQYAAMPAAAVAAGDDVQLDLCRTSTQQTLLHG